ncbi:MAG: beta-lactamase family protein [Actinobacteria bacterium]|nr:beta-lactamase family protein [Actinomycetota bacterium]
MKNIIKKILIILISLSVIYLISSCKSISISESDSQTTSIYQDTNIDINKTNEIDSYIESKMKEYRIPGLALSIVQGDKIIYMKGFGVADPSGRPVTPQTPFIIGSTGKSITAAALMQLVDAGKVTLDKPVQYYLSWFSLADKDKSAKITVRMLLNHASGIPFSAGTWSQAYNDTSDHALEDQIRSFSSVVISHEPGTVYEYANANYQIVGMIIQSVSNQSFQSYIQENIYKPLEMYNSYSSKDEAFKHGLATGYRYWFGFPIHTHNLPYSYRHFPAGWYISSTEDLAHFLMLHINDGIYNKQRLVSAQGIYELHHPALENYAMGWVVKDEFLSHNGSVPDYGSTFGIDTKNKIGVVVLFNVNTGSFDERLYSIEPNIMNIMNNTELISPNKNSFFLPRFIGLLILIVLQIIWVIMSARRLKLWARGFIKIPLKFFPFLFKVGLPLIIELILVFFLLYNLQLNGMTILTSILYQPDLSILTLFSAFSALIWGILRTVLSIKLIFPNRFIKKYN